MALLFLDTFTGTPGDDLSVYNQAWVKASGAAGVMVINADGGSANTDSSGGTAAYVRTDVVPASADYFVSVNLTVPGSVPSGPAAGVMLRSTTANTGYEARFLSSGSSSGTWQIRRIIAGTASTLASVVGSYVPPQTFNLKLDAQGSTIALYLDGSATPLLTATDSSITAPGSPGLRGFNALSTRFRHDNLGVDDGLVAGAQPVSGSLNATLGSLVGSGTATVRAAGSLAVTLGSLTQTAAGAVGISGAAAAQLGSLAASGVGAVAASGSLTKTLGALTQTAAGAATISGALVKALGPVTLAASGNAGTAPGETPAAIVGTLSRMLAPATLAAAGTVAVAGGITTQLGSCTLAAAGTVRTGGQAATTLGALGLVAAGGVRIDGGGQVVLGGLTLQAAGDGVQFTPSERRTYRFAAENRRYAVPAENRTFKFTA